MIVRLNAITYIRFCQVRMEAAKSVSQVLNYCKKIQAKIHFQKSTSSDLSRYLGEPKFPHLQNYRAVQYQQFRQSRASDILIVYLGEDEEILLICLNFGIQSSITILLCCNLQCKMADLFYRLMTINVSLEVLKLDNLSLLYSDFVWISIFQYLTNDDVDIIPWKWGGTYLLFNFMELFIVYISFSLPPSTGLKPTIHVLDMLATIYRLREYQFIKKLIAEKSL